MAGRPSAGRRGRRQRRKRSAHDRAVARHSAAAKSLIRLVRMARTAASMWSHMDELAIDEAGREAAVKMSTGSADRREMAEGLLKACCLDVTGSYEMVPGVWRDDIAAGAEGMAALDNMAAARWCANGGMASASTASVVFAELSASGAWMDFAAKVAAAERAALGTALDARPVAERAAAAARHAERSVPTLPREESVGGGAAAAVGAMGTGASSGQAAEAGRRAAAAVRDLSVGAVERAAMARRDAAGVWAESSALWSRVRRDAAREGDAAAEALASVQARTAKEHATRLRAA